MLCLCSVSNSLGAPWINAGWQMDSMDSNGGRLSSSPAGMAESASLAKGREDGAVERIFLAIPFGMPLHRIGKSGSVPDLERLDQAVAGMAQGLQAVGQARNALAMQGIDPCSLAAGPGGKHAAGRKTDFMCGPVGHVHTDAVGVAVIEIFALPMHALRKRSAQGHVDFLKTAADAEQWHAAGPAGPHQRQRKGVALQIERQARLAHFLAEMGGMHIRRRAGEQHTIDQRQQRRDLGCFGQGKHHRLGMGALLECPGVFVAQHQKRCLVTFFT